MVVVHVVNFLIVGGLENGVVNLVNRQSDGFRHTIVCMTRTGAMQARLNPRVNVFSLGKRPGHDPRAFLQLVRLLRRIRPDLVHSRNWSAVDAIMAARLARVPIVVHGEHGRDILDPEGQNTRRRCLRRILAPLVDRFVTVSDDLRQWLVDKVGIPPRKIVTIHNGVETKKFAPGDSSAARAALGIPPDRPVVGTVGRLDPIKDHDTLLRAFARLRVEVPAALLVIAGDGVLRGSLERLADSLGVASHVRFLGERHDIPTVLRSFDVFLLSSIGEGISNTILEAMATGLPIVATRVGGNPELVEEGGNGVLVPHRDPAALARAVGAYLGDAQRCANHGAASRNIAVRRFSLEGMCEAYARLYLDLSGVQGGGGHRGGGVSSARSRGRDQ